VQKIINLSSVVF